MGKNVSADHETAEHYVKEFAMLVTEKNLTADHIYSVDETEASADEVAPAGDKNASGGKVLTLMQLKVFLYFPFIMKPVNGLRQEHNLAPWTGFKTIL